MFDRLLETSATIITADRVVEDEDRDDSGFVPEEVDMGYPPVARVIMWGYSFQKNRLMEDMNTIRILDLP